MYKITINADYVLLENDGQDLLRFPEDYKINLYGVTYCMTRWGIGDCFDGSIAVPSHCYQPYYQRFKKRMRLVYYLTKLFKHYKVPYKIVSPDVCSFTNLKGQIYACYL